MEEVDSISVAVSGIDINKVEPLDTRRIVAFINHFLCTSVTFLNQFASKCEAKLEELQFKIHRLESHLRILECKLASIPPQQLSSVANPSQQSQPQVPENNSDSAKSQSQPVTTALPNSQGVKASQEEKAGDDELESIPDSEDGFKGQSSASSDGGVAGGSEPKPNPRDDPRYAKYFKMAAVGVPIPAIKIKMSSEGVDPSILDL